VARLCFGCGFAAWVGFSERWGRGDGTLRLRSGQALNSCPDALCHAEGNCGKGAPEGRSRSLDSAFPTFAMRTWGPSHPSDEDLSPGAPTARSVRENGCDCGFQGPEGSCSLRLLTRACDAGGEDAASTAGQETGATGPRRGRSGWEGFGVAEGLTERQGIGSSQ